MAATEDSLTQCIVDIRKAIGDEERRVLRTVPRKGNILVSYHPDPTAVSAQFRSRCRFTLSVDARECGFEQEPALGSELNRHVGALGGPCIKLARPADAL